MKNIIRTVIILVTYFLFSDIAFAASLTLSAANTSPIVGSNVAVTVNGSGLAGKVSLTSSNGGVLSGGAQSFWIENETKTFTFKANSVGSATITLTPIDVADFSGNIVSASKSVTVNVKNKPVIILSDNNNLSNLSVGDYSLTPEFSQGTLEYSVTLPAETTSVEIAATPAQSGAQVSGAGVREVTDGDNRIEIIVTAENGSSKTYVLNVKVEEYNPISVKVDGKDYTVVRKKSQLEAPANYTEATVKINDEDIPAFKSEITKYTLVALKDDKGNQNFYVYDNGNYILYKEYGFSKLILSPLEMDKNLLPKNYKKTNITYNDEKITAYKLKESSKYALIYAMNVETGDTDLYMYDEKENTVQIYNNEELRNLEKTNDLYLKIIIGLSILSILLVGVLIYMLVKKGKKDDKLKNKDKKEEIK